MLVSGAVFAAPADAGERLIVRFDGQIEPADRAGAIRAADARTLETLATGARVVVASDGPRARRRLARDPRVAAVETDRAVTAAAATPHDPAFGSLWGLRNTGQTIGSVAGTAGEDVRALDAWDRTQGAGSTVAVLDTGTDLAIADLQANAWRNPGETADNGLDDDGNGKVDDVFGWSFTSDSADVADDHGHGTHVAGTAVAAADNGSGIAGVAPEARLMTVKVLAADGSGWTSDIAEGFEYAARQGADVVNASLGGSGWSAYLRDAIARHPDVLLVAAAGNDALDVDSSPQFPCAYDLPNVVCVASHDNTGALSSFSNYGDAGVDLTAPGRHVLSWLPGGTLAYMSGTSMATPHVAGAAALATSDAAGVGPEQVRQALIATARRSPALAGSSVSGGALDAAALLAALSAAPGSPPTVLAAPTVSGEAVVGQTVTASGASFLGAESVTWRWESCADGGGGCQTIGDASGPQLGLADALAGHRVRALAIAANAAGTTTAASAMTATIATPAPWVFAPPGIVGRAVTGNRLVADLGTWRYGAPVSVRFERCAADATRCTPVASGDSYTVAANDPGYRLRVVVQAAGPGGVTSAASPATPPVTTARRPPTLTITSARRRTKRGRPMLRLAGRVSEAGTVTVRVCRQNMGRACRTVRARAGSSRWNAQLGLPGPPGAGRMTVRATLTTANGRRATIARTL